MIITTWIVYILARKGAGLPFPPKTSSVSSTGGSHVGLLLVYLFLLGAPAAHTWTVLHPETWCVWGVSQYITWVKRGGGAGCLGVLRSSSYQFLPGH